MHSKRTIYVYDVVYSLVNIYAYIHTYILGMNNMDVWMDVCMHVTGCVRIYCNKFAKKKLKRRFNVDVRIKCECECEEDNQK